jgi:hypothetical protein
MRANEPEVGPCRVLPWQGRLDVFLIIIGRQIERVARGHILVKQRVVFDDTELLGRIVEIAVFVAVEFFVRRFLLLLLGLLATALLFCVFFLVFKEGTSSSLRVVSVIIVKRHGLHESATRVTSPVTAFHGFPEVNRVL